MIARCNVVSPASKVSCSEYSSISFAGQFEFLLDNREELPVQVRRPVPSSTAAMPMSAFASTISASAVSARMKYHSRNMSRICRVIKLLTGRGEAAAKAIPAREHEAGLRPRKNPGYGSQILNPTACAARGWARADAHALNQINWR